MEYTIRKNTRITLLRKQNGLCYYCQRIMTADLKSHLSVTVEHLTPLAHGGTHHHSNLVGACMQCNNARGTMDHELFRRYVRRFGPTTPLHMARTNRTKFKRAAKAVVNMRGAGLPEERINNIMYAKFEAAILAKVKELDQGT